MPSLNLPLKALEMTISWEQEEHEEDATIRTTSSSEPLSQDQLSALSVIELMVLEHFKAGVDILSRDYLLGLETVINHKVTQ